MKEPVAISFAKYHGLGNPFIISPAEGLPRPLAEVARAICDPHTGVGADGFIVLLPPRNRKHHARVRIFNADGSEAEMSGNGIRCVGAMLAEYLPRMQLFVIETMAGVRVLELITNGERKGRIFRTAMGKPLLDADQIPFRVPAVSSPIVGYPLSARSVTVHVTVTSMGNPHCSIFVDDFEALDWPALGQELERRTDLFPNRTNVEFVRVISRDEIEVRFWERGVGRTMSSGTGSCAAAVASVLNGRTGRRIKVRTLAGNLTVEWLEDGKVMLTGPAEEIARGTYLYRPRQVI
jgi:diaminopimelate epimerase